MPAHTNRLVSETSPYLLQHAHNPVNWFPWGDEALQKAKDENKAILHRSVIGLAFYRKLFMG